MSKKKNNQNIRSRKLDYVDILLFMAPFLTGLFSIWSLALFSVLCLSGIMYKVIKNKKIIIPTGKNIVFILIYLLGFLIVEFCAVDKGMNMLAFFKNLTILFFIILCLQFETAKENNDVNLKANKFKDRFRYIPYSACITVIISLLLMINPASTVFDNDRLQGIWNYANSYGLFLLIGVFILANKEKLTLKDYCVFAILFVGIILTNSRAIIILTFITIGTCIFTNKTNFKKIIALAICFALLFGGVYLFSNMEKRVNKDMLESSELVTRLLYYNDAIRIIKDHPLGIGYDGWYYKQVEIQTGVYDTKFVHNSILQVLLDVGIVPTIALFLMLAMTFFSKEQNAFSRIIMILILGHSLIDIDLEYMYFILIITMFIDFNKSEIKINKYKNLIICSMSLLAIWYFMIFISDACYKSKAYKDAVAIIPFHTEAIQEVLYDVTSKEEQLEYAQKALKYNKIVSGAYEALSNDLQEKGEYIDALEMEETRLGYNKYSMYNYMVYADFLTKGVEFYSKTNRIDNEKIFLEKIIEIETTINNVLNNTDPLCYKTIHVPEIEVNDDLQSLISMAKMRLEAIENS